MDEEPETHMSLERIGGVWANAVEAYLTPTEFTLDFIRRDPAEAIGVCVARISFAALTARDLLDKLTPLWRQWVESSNPQEGS